MAVLAMLRWRISTYNAAVLLILLAVFLIGCYTMRERKEPHATTPDNSPEPHPEEASVVIRNSQSRTSLNGNSAKARPSQPRQITIDTPIGPLNLSMRAPLRHAIPQPFELSPQIGFTAPQAGRGHAQGTGTPWFWGLRAAACRLLLK